MLLFVLDLISMIPGSFFHTFPVPRACAGLRVNEKCFSIVFCFVGSWGSSYRDQV